LLDLKDRNHGKQVKEVDTMKIGRDKLVTNIVVLRRFETEQAVMNVADLKVFEWK